MNGKLTRTNRRALRRCLPVLLLLLASGCSSKGTVSGTITYQGKAIAVGTVTFLPEQGGGVFTAPIHDGAYRVENLPPGLAKIAVSTPSVSPDRLKNMMKPPEKIFGKVLPDKSAEGSPTPPSKTPRTAPIPRKYQNLETTDLTYTVKSGEQVHDIDIPAK